MNKSHNLSYKFLWGVSLLLLCGCLLAFMTFDLKAAAAPSAAKAPYMVNVDSISGMRGGLTENSLIVCDNYALAIGDPIEVIGWLATDEGVHHYECAWVPAAGGTPQWRATDSQKIINRPDLTDAGMPYVSGHPTAGYELTIYPDEDMADGYYDLYVRAITGGDLVCDLLVLANVTYGAPDIIQNGTYSFSFSRLTRDRGALTDCSVKDGKLLLREGGMAKLGYLDMGLFESIKITYSVPKAFTTQKQAVVGLKSSPDHPYGDGTGKYDMTDNILYLPVDTSQEGTVQELEVDLRSLHLTYSGDIYLCGYNSDTVQIHSLALAYNDQGHTRTAAKLYFGEDTLPYFSGYNYIALSGVDDPVMGNVLRLSITEDTNDPYVSFNAESLMKAYDVHLNAGEYKYMVVLARAASHNLGNYTTFYLAAGSIIGATEDCTYTFEMAKDDQWHYYLIDLSQKDTWNGTIHNWRFDIVNGDSLGGDYIDIATVQFFRTQSAAQKASQASTTHCDTPYASGQPLLVKDMQEETAEDDEMIFTIPPKDCFVVTEAETPPPSEPETTPENVTNTDTSSTQAVPNEGVTDPSDEPADTQSGDMSTGSGCTSVAGIRPVALILTLTALAMIYNKNKKIDRRIQS